MSDDWTDRLAGARMQVDQRYEETIEGSSFTSQEWGLVMTAVDWKMDDPENPEEAELLADTSKLSEIVPELERIQSEMGGSQQPVEEGAGNGGFLGRIQQYIDHLRSNRSGESAEKRLADATELVDGYALELQAFLEEHDRWEEICAAAASQESESTA